MSELLPREKIYRFIVEYKQSHDGNSPTIRQIGAHCGVNSTSHVIYCLKQLEKLELIQRSDHRIGERSAARIEVVGGCWTMEGCNA